MKLGYARVSTEDQRLDLQRTRLTEAGCGRLFEEKISGAARQRPALERLLEELRADDVLVVTRLDRLARSTAELLRLAEAIAGKAGLQSLESLTLHVSEGCEAHAWIQKNPSAATNARASSSGMTTGPKSPGAPQASRRHHRTWTPSPSPVGRSRATGPPVRRL